MFVTAPRTWKADTQADAPDLRRYSRLEHGTPDPTWITTTPAANGKDEGADSPGARTRWARGDDAALEEWLGGGTPSGRRGARTTA